MLRWLVVLCLLMNWRVASGQRGVTEITAKIVLEDGSPISTAPLISLYVPGARYSCLGQESFLGGTIRLRIPFGEIDGERIEGCSITVMLDGYRKFTGFVKEGTVITMRRLGANEGSSVSVASLNAPPDAKKVYEKGEAAAAKKKWAQAEEFFRTAVGMYPKYAVAWSELGQALLQQGRFDDAVEALKKAQQSDPAYIKPLVQMAGVSSMQERWDEEMQISDKAMTLHPVEYPLAYYYRAEAAFHLGKIDDAERFTREALQLDPGGSCPESLILLGEIFEKQGKPQDAIVEYKGYLKVAKNGPRAQEARNSLARLR